MELFIFFILCCFGILIWRDHKDSFDQIYTTKTESVCKDSDYTPDLTSGINDSRLSDLLDMEPYNDRIQSLPLDTDLGVLADPDPSDIQS